MRLILGIASLVGAIYMVRQAMEFPTNHSIGKILASIPLMVMAYLFLRKLMFSPLELWGFNYFAGGTTINQFDNRFKNVQEKIKKGQLKAALEELDAILKKYPKFKQAQVRKIQLLANNFYDIGKALEYSKEVLATGSFNRNKIDILILISAMLRKQGYPDEANNLAAIYKNKARGKLKAVIERMEESWSNSSRVY